MKKLLSVLSSFFLLFLFTSSVSAAKAEGVGFDENGYNDKANIFNGSGMEWCIGKGLSQAWCDSYLGDYANDNIVMKWNEEWDRGNAEDWLNPPYNAWLNNNWNGMVADGSQSVWHYKYVWVGPCGADYTPLENGGYCLWGQFEVLMDQGKDPSYGPGHFWFGHALPGGYGSY